MRHWTLAVVVALGFVSAAATPLQLRLRSYVETDCQPPGSGNCYGKLKWNTTTGKYEAVCKNNCSGACREPQVGDDFTCSCTTDEPTNCHAVMHRYAAPGNDTLVCNPVNCTSSPCSRVALSQGEPSGQETQCCVCE